MEKYRAFPAMIERIEQIGEHRGRNALDPDHGEAMTEVLDRFPEAGPLVASDLDLLYMRFWMHYAAGLKHPEEATDVTLRRWAEDE